MAATVEYVDKDLVRGDDLDIELVVTEPADTPQEEQAPTPVDLTGSLLQFTVKKTRADGASVHADPVVIYKSSDDISEIEVVDAAGGKAVIHLLAADTKFLAPGIYVYDIRVRTAANKNYTLARGRLYLLGDVTAAEDTTVP